MTTPLRTPRPIGPHIAMSAKTNSMRLMRQICLRAARSIRLMAVAARIAPSAGIGIILRAGAEKQQCRDQGRGGHDARHLRAAANGQVDCRARVGGRHREGAEKARGDVRSAKSDQLAVRIDRIATDRPKAAGRNDARRRSSRERSPRSRGPMFRKEGQQSVATSARAIPSGYRRPRRCRVLQSRRPPKAPRRAPEPALAREPENA